MPFSTAMCCVREAWRSDVNGFGGSPLIMKNASLFPWLLGAGLGLAGFLLNFANFSMAFGLDFIMGGTFALVALRILGTGPGVLAAAISGAATFFLWNHPYAAFVFTCEVAFIGWLVHWKNIPTLIAAAIFWVVAGAPLLALTYGGFMGMDNISVYLVMAKQAMNGMIQVMAVEALLASVFLVSQRAGAALGLARVSLRDLMFIALVGFATVPVMVTAIFVANDGFDRIFQEAQNHASKLSKESQKLLEITATSTEKAIIDSLADPALLRFSILSRNVASLRLNFDDPARQNFSYGPVVDAAGLPLPAIKIASNHRFVTPDGRGGVMELSVLLTSFSRVFALMPITEPLAEISVTRAADGETIFAWPHKNIFAKGDGREETLSKNSYIYFPALPGKSIMQLWAKAWVYTEEQWSRAGGYIISVGIPIGPKISDYRKGLLKLLTFSSLFLLFIPLVALPISGLVGRSLYSLSLAMRRLSKYEFNQTSIKLEQSAIREVYDLGIDFTAMLHELHSRGEDAARNRLRLERLIHDAPAAIFIRSIKDGKVSQSPSFIGASAEHILGYSNEEMREPDWVRANMHPDDVPAAGDATESLLRDNKVALRFRFRHKDGVYRHIYCEEQVISDLNLIGYEVIILWLDQTKLVEAERKLIQSTKLTDLGQMATGMAHELTQPLNVIDLAAANLMGRLLRGKSDPDYVIGKVKRIREQVTRAVEIINHMRVFGRADQAPLKVFSVSDVIKNVELLYGSQLRTSGIAFVITDDMPDASVLGQSMLLEQVLVNLITNAHYQVKLRKAKKSDAMDGEHAIDLRVFASPDGKSIKITICDTGGGIDPDILPRIFEPFVTSKPVGEGTGLGLSVSYGIINDMSGSMDMENKGEGACFTIGLPIAGGAAA
ncbi:MAG: signal transduction histidine kinase [Alphaproteobacteria bacterium]